MFMIIVFISSCQREDVNKKYRTSNRFSLNQSVVNSCQTFDISKPDIQAEPIYKSRISKDVGEMVQLSINEVKPSRENNIISKNKPLDYNQGYSNIQYLKEKPVRLIRVTFDNDIFNNTDYYYTNGVAVELFNPIAGQSPLSRLLLGVRSSDINLYGISIIQNIYTPTNPDIPEISEGDRPFSAFLTIGQIRESYSLKQRLSVTSRINFGVLGPASMGGVVQSSIHNIEPIGWNNQINNNFVLDYSINIEKGIISNPNFELNLTAGGNIGTVFNNMDGGFYFRAGSFTPVLKGNVFNPEGTFQYWFFIESKANLIFYDATLQGGLFGHNDLYTINSKDINRIVLQASAGFAIYYNNLGLELQNFYISPEFKNAYDFRWGRIKLIFNI